MSNNKIDSKLWGEASEATFLPSLVVGPQVCKVVKVEDIEDKEYLKIYFDIVTGDYKGHFAESKERFDDWPNSGIIYKSYKTQSYPFLKAFVVALEKSNTGYSFAASQYDFQSFVNKQMVVVFGEEEIPFLDDDNKIKISIKPREVRSMASFTEGKIKTPTLKKLTEEQKAELFASINNKEATTPNNIQETKNYEASKQLASEEDLPF